MSDPAATTPSGVPGRRTHRPRVPRAERRDQFLDIAAQLLLVDGAESVTLQRVARLAEANHATIYRSFDHRDALLIALAERSSVRLDAAALDALTHPELGQRLCDLITAFLSPDIQRDMNILTALASVPPRSAELRAWQGRRAAETIAFLVDLFRAGFPNLSVPSAVILASAMGAAVTGIVALADAGTPVPLLAESFTRICLAAATELAEPGATTTLGP